MQTVALWHHFSAVRSIGRRLASESRVPVGEVRRPPVIAMAAALWMVVSLLLSPIALFVQEIASRPGVGGYHMSAPYSILGNATLM
jgi:hypothetical protein